MKRIAAISAVVLILASVVALAAPSADSKTVTGTVARLDTTQKMLVVKDSDARETTIYWKDDTTVIGELQEGQQVRVETKEADGKTWAKLIQVQAKRAY